MKNIQQNTQQKESGLLHLLLECVNILEHNDAIKRFTSINNLDIFKHNFKSLYSDVNDLDILNESEDSFNNILESDSTKPDLQLTVKSNVYVQLKKSLHYINSTERGVISALNESLKPLNEENSFKYDISEFKIELNNVLNRLKNQDDTKLLSNDVLKIKTSLQSPINVFGLDLYKLIDEIAAMNTNLFAVVYNKSEHELILIYSNKEVVTDFEVYSITNDCFFKLISSEKYKKCKDIFITDPRPNIHNYLQSLKNKIGHNIIQIYIDIDRLGLKFTDNIYKDGARLSAIENYKKENMMTDSQIANMINGITT